MSRSIGSLFSGAVDGLARGLEAAGWGPLRWMAEVDEWRRDQLARQWPGVPIYSDVREVHDVEPVDLICGGFPCQDISPAGRRAGIAGERSGLWSEFARIIRLVRPRVVVVENVAALLGRGMDVVLGDLAACGYDATWDCIPAAAVGAPHRRDRLFVVAWRIPNPKQDRIRHLAERGQSGAQAPNRRDAESIDVGAQPVANGCSQRQPSERATHDDYWRDALRHVSDRCDQERASGAGPFPPGPVDVHAWGRVQAESQPALCRLAHGVPDRSRWIAALGDSVVPQCAEVAGRVAMMVTGAAT